MSSIKIPRFPSFFVLAIAVASSVLLITLISKSNQSQDPRSQAHYENEDDNNGTVQPTGYPDLKERDKNDSRRVSEADKKIKDLLTRKDPNHADLAKLLSDRKQTIKQLMIDNPAVVLANAEETQSLQELVPDDLKNTFETKEKVEGKISTIHRDDLELHSSLNLPTLTKSDGTQIHLHFIDRAPILRSGTSIQTTGVLLDDQMVVIPVDGHELKETSSVKTVLGTTTAYKVAVIMINFQDDTTQPFTKQTVRQITYTNTDNNGVNAYVQENSQNSYKIEGYLQPDGDIFGWYTLPIQKANGCDERAWATAAQQAATPDGFSSNNYQAVIYAFPSVSSCNNLGAATLDEHPGQVWINGYYETYVLSHELGHTFGNDHASSYKCVDDNAARVSLSTNCTSSEYGDPFDVMGDAVALHQFNTAHKVASNFFASTNAQTVTSDGQFTIYPTEQLTGQTQTLIIPSRNLSYYATPLNYYLEYRRPLGLFDRFLSSDPVANGVSIRLAPAYGVIEQSQLIDTTPGTSTYLDSALLAGKTFTDEAEGISITTLSADSNSATVQIAFTAKKCIRMKPQFELVTPQSWGVPGDTFTTLVKIKNVDSDSCGDSTFTLNSTEPPGFTHQFGASSLTIAPGDTYTVGFQIKSGAGKAAGDYTFTPAVSRTTGSGNQTTGTFHLSPLNTSGQPICPTTPPSCNNGMQFAVTPGVCSVYYCSAVTPLPTVTPSCTHNGKQADFNDDSKVNLTDYSILVSEFLKTGIVFTADANCDGKVNLSDYLILVKEFLK